MEKITYLDQSLKKGIIIRWPSTAMPLKVFISPCRWYKATGSESHFYKKMALQAFDDWHRASRGVVSFQFVNSLYESQINLEWKRAERKSLGHCYFGYDGKKRLFSAEVEIGLSDGLIHAQYQNKNEVYHTILHEIGHALGLGHSPYKNDIMYVPHQYGISALSERDKKTVTWLYSLPAANTPEEASKKIVADPFFSLDDMVLHLEKASSQNNQSESVIIEDSGDGVYEQRDLYEDQELIADMNLYNLALQNINIKPALKEYINKTRIQKKNQT